MSTLATAAPAAKPDAPLSDLMLAMDVVDTLRHRDKLVERELGEGEREEDLIERLRGIYKNQGMEVSDEILRQGVRALREERFVYKPPADSVAVKLAKLYVARDAWGKWVIGAFAAIGIGTGGMIYQDQAAKTELSQTIPASINRIAGDIRRDSTNAAVASRLDALTADGLRYARDGNAAQARVAVTTLEHLRDEVRAEYDVRIVNRRDELTGVIRQPLNNPTAARSFYLVVEAIGRDGRPLSRAITNETDGQTRVVTIWAQRVPEGYYRQIEADKRDDGIIQNNILGRKVRGELEPQWRVPLPGGAILNWNRETGRAS